MNTDMIRVLLSVMYEVFVLFRVSSWIVTKFGSEGTIHEITRINTRRL